MGICKTSERPDMARLLDLNCVYSCVPRAGRISSSLMTSHSSVASLHRNKLVTYSERVTSLKHMFPQMVETY